MRDLKGRCAFITGAASGIGLGLAQACAEAGMKLVLADIDLAALREAEAHFIGRDVAVLALSLDVRDAAAWHSAADRAEQAFGPLHLLCNNVGITGSGRRIGELDAAEWQMILDINLGGMFNGISCLLPRMQARGEPAHIVNTASMGALLPYAGGGAYVASKGGMLSFSEALAEELHGSDIGVSVLLPGMVRTRLFETSAQQLAPGQSAVMSRREQASLSLTRDGLDPLDVGRHVLAAVRENRLHIFTHPELRDAVAARFGAMLAQMV